MAGAVLVVVTVVGSTLRQLQALERAVSRGILVTLSHSEKYALVVMSGMVSMMLMVRGMMVTAPATVLEIQF
jgi:hypothetical protein